MKTGLNLIELAQQIQARAKRKADFVAPSREIAVANVEDRPALVLKGHEPLAINAHAHGQIAAHLEIPAKYYDRMRAEAPVLWASNVNTWLAKNDGERRMVRTIDNTTRAFLSDKYSRMDDEHFAETVLPAIIEVAGAEVVSAEITETWTHIKFVSRLKQRDVKPGNTIAFGIAFSNSEVGAGALSGSLFTERLVCRNGMVVPSEVFSSRHTGQRHLGRDLGEIFQLDTVRADAGATILKLRDFTREILTDRFMDEHVAQLQVAAGVAIKDPFATVERLGKVRGFTEGERQSVLAHLLRSGDHSLFGLAQAVTRTAEDLDDYNRATEFERAGGELIEMKRPMFRELAVAA